MKSISVFRNEGKTVNAKSLPEFLIIFGHTVGFVSVLSGTNTSYSESLPLHQTAFMNHGASYLLWTLGVLQLSLISLLCFSIRYAHTLNSPG